MYTILIIGRANVGKSSLFNKIVGHRNALVSKIPGTTRDTNWARVEWNKHTFILGDSAGFEDMNPDLAKKKPGTGGVHGNLQDVVERKVFEDIKKADERILVFDGETGLLPQDLGIIQLLKKKGYSFLIVVNKIDGTKDQSLLADFHELNIPFFSTSAASGIGIGDVLDAVTNHLPAHDSDTAFKPSTTIRVALLGKPNVGKSTLVNALTKTELMLTSPEPHTTREPHDISIPVNETTELVLIDTAGVRRKSRISNFVEIASVRMSIKTMEKADVVLFIIDFDDPDSAQDKALARLIAEQKKPCIIVANKYDLLQTQLAADPYATATDRQGLLTHVERQIRGRFPFLKYAPIQMISALSHYRIHEMVQAILTVYGRAHTPIPDTELEAFRIHVLKKQLPPIVGIKKRRAQLQGIFQNEYRLWEFILKVKSKDPIPMNYIKFVEKELKDHFDLSGVSATVTVDKTP